MRYVDWRVLVGFGFVLFAVSCLMNGYLSFLTAGPQLRLPQLIRAMGQPFMIVPLTLARHRAQRPRGAGRCWPCST